MDLYSGSPRDLLGNLNFEKFNKNGMVLYYDSKKDFGNKFENLLHLLPSNTLCG